MHATHRDYWQHAIVGIQMPTGGQTTHLSFDVPMCEYDTVASARRAGRIEQHGRCFGIEVIGQRTLRYEGTILSHQLLGIHGRRGDTFWGGHKTMIEHNARHLQLLGQILCHALAFGCANQKLCLAVSGLATQLISSLIWLQRHSNLSRYPAAPLYNNPQCIV